MSRNLVVHYRRVSYLIEPTKEALKLGGRKVGVHGWHDGRVEIRCGAITLAYATVDKEPHVSPGDVVENKRLGAVLATIQAAQTKRTGLRASRSPASTPTGRYRCSSTASPPSRRRGAAGRVFLATSGNGNGSSLPPSAAVVPGVGAGRGGAGVRLIGCGGTDRALWSEHFYLARERTSLLGLDIT
jgi:hypothetical protein